jgi:hypothetical protein
MSPSVKLIICKEAFFKKAEKNPISENRLFKARFEKWSTMTLLKDIH